MAIDQIKINSTAYDIGASASNISFNKNGTSLDATNVQSAIVEIDSDVSALDSNKVDKVNGKGLSTNDFTDAAQTKLNGIETGAQVNTITGVKGSAEQDYRIGNVSISKADIGLANVDNTSDVNKPISTATQNALNNKVDKVIGKGLSTEDYTTAEKNKLDTVSDYANHVNVTRYGTEGTKIATISCDGIDTDIYTGGGTISDAMMKGIDYVTAGRLEGSDLGTKATAEGYNVVASGDYSHAEGQRTTACGEGCSHAEGHETYAFGDYSHAEGGSSKAIGNYSHAEGAYTTANGFGCHTEGQDTYASNNCAHAEGFRTCATGHCAHAEGNADKNGMYSGAPLIASGASSHAEGFRTSAIGDYSHAEGLNAYAMGQGSHAEGGYEYNYSAYKGGSALGNSSHAEGQGTTAKGLASHAEGHATYANSEFQHAEGRYNIIDTEDKYAHIIGNGTSTTRSNAFTVSWDGDVTAGRSNGLTNDNKLPTGADVNNYIHDVFSDHTVTGNPITFDAFTGLEVTNECKVTMNPIQDLHGYSNPWAGGAGKNILNTNVFNDTKYFEINSDGSITQKKADGRAENSMPTLHLSAGTYIFSRGSTNGTCRVYGLIGGSWVTFVNNDNESTTITLSEACDLYIKLSTNGTFPAVFYPMITLSTVTDQTFAPYSNICPISGRTEASVTRIGKNVFDLAKYLTDNSITYTKDGDWFIFSIGSALYANKFTLPELAYYSGQLIIDSSRTVATNVNLRTYKNGSVVTQGQTFTNQQIDQVGFNYSTTGQVCCKVQTEYGSTATAYEPYTAETHTHQYSETIYGGVDDFVNGGLANEWGYIASYDGETLPGEWISDRDIYAPNTSPTTGAEVVYKLATPTTIETSAENISLLKGNNVLSTNADDMELKYSADIKTYIDKAIQTNITDVLNASY